MPRPSRLPASARRAQLLDVCGRIVDVEGFEAASLDRVAAESGVSRTVLYQHFGGLEGLFDALVERAVCRAEAALTDAVGDWSRMDPVEAMGRILEAADADPATWRLFLVIPPAGPVSLTEGLERARAAIRRKGVDGLGSRLGSGAAGNDPELSVRLLQSVADELVRLRLADPAQYTHDRLLARYAAIAAALFPVGRRSRC